MYPFLGSGDVLDNRDPMAMVPRERGEYSAESLRDEERERGEGCLWRGELELRDEVVIGEVG